MQIKSFQELANELRKPIPGHKPSVPSPAKTPAPVKSKVVSIPTRTPINRQAALLVSPIRCWLSQPLPPEKLPNPFEAQMEVLKADLKIERNDHAATRDALGTARAKIRELNQHIDTQQKLIKSLQSSVATKDETIRQLEDLKL